MRKHKEIILSILVAAGFWLLAIGSSPEIARSVPCETLPNPKTVTHFISVKLVDGATNEPIKNAQIFARVEHSQYFPATQEGGGCSTKSTRVDVPKEKTNSSGIAVFALTRTYTAPTEIIQGYIRIEIPSYDLVNHSFLLFHDSGDKATTIPLVKKNKYP
ncbi:MAG: hypothetical protein KBF57_07930 [Saprospiraceae bacterium]|jgi:hypothetical protein|nr:hypothetical protein [Saprospiraceae bacterium]MBP9194599.1 hypothetical protein [Saprospiraceae bacterium]